MDADAPDLVLTDSEARALGGLVEKSMATPDYYPLTLNSLTAACNQKSNRDPVMSLDSTEVVRALDGLRDKKLAWEGTSSASRVPKYRHRFDERFGTTEEETVLLCELLLRGPQTPGELRTHASRLTACTVESVTAALDRLGDREDFPFVVLLPREPGKRERRYAHRLCGDPVPATADAAPASAPEPARVAVREADDRIASLDGRLETVEAAVAALRERLDAFIDEFK